MPAFDLHFLDGRYIHALQEIGDLSFTSPGTRLPLILAPGDYVRWLGDEPDPGDLLVPAEPMRMWPISSSRRSSCLRHSEKSAA